MGFLIAGLIAVAAVIGAGRKEQSFSNDTTRQDTVAFEKRALEERLVRLESKERQVYQLDQSDSEKLAQNKSRQEKIEAKIASLEKLEKEKGWTQ